LEQEENGKSKKHNNNNNNKREIKAKTQRGRKEASSDQNSQICIPACLSLLKVTSLCSVEHPAMRAQGSGGIGPRIVKLRH
jgi:hypothetical protein